MYDGALVANGSYGTLSLGTTDCRINRIDDVVAFIYCFSMNRNDGD